MQLPSGFMILRHISKPLIIFIVGFIIISSLLSTQESQATNISQQNTSSDGIFPDESLLYSINRAFTGPTPGGDTTRQNGLHQNGTHIFFVSWAHPSVHVYTMDGSFAGRIGNTTFGTGDGKLQSPVSVTSNTTHILVLDETRDDIQIFDLAGNFVSKFGSGGNEVYQFTFPKGILMNETHIFVLDSGKDGIMIFSHSGNYVTTYGSSGTGDGQFTFPRDFDYNGTHFAVVDEDRPDVQLLDARGNFVLKYDVAFDTHGVVLMDFGYVVSTWGRIPKVQAYDYNGNEFESLSHYSFLLPTRMDTNGTHVFILDLNQNFIAIIEMYAPVLISGLISIANGTGIELHWDLISLPNPSMIQGYYIYRAPASTGTFVLQDQVNASTNFYFDSEVIVNTDYLYRVEAYTSDVSGNIDTSGSSVVQQKLELSTITTTHFDTTTVEATTTVNDIITEVQTTTQTNNITITEFESASNPTQTEYTTIVEISTHTDNVTNVKSEVSYNLLGVLIFPILHLTRRYYNR